MTRDLLYVEKSLLLDIEKRLDLLYTKVISLGKDRLKGLKRYRLGNEIATDSGYQ